MIPAGKQLKSDYQWEAKAQWRVSRSKATSALPSRCTSALGYFHKLSMDALTGIVWLDDSQIRQATVTMAYDKVKTTY